MKSSHRSIIPTVKKVTLLEIVLITTTRPFLQNVNPFSWKSLSALELTEIPCHHDVDILHDRDGKTQRMMGCHNQVCSDSRLPQHGYMTQYYYSQSPIYVNESMVLELTNRFLTNTPATHYLSCDVTVVTFSTHKLFVHFEAIKIYSAVKDIDRLHIYDFKESGDSFRVSPPQGLYGLSDLYKNGIPGGVNDYMSSGYRLRLDYQGKPTLAYNEARGDCGHDYVQCHQKLICVPVSTWCDGHHNCGNDEHSDEMNCDHSTENKWTPTDGLTVAGVTIAVSCTVFLLDAGIIMFIIIRENKRDEFTTNISIEFMKKSQQTMAESFREKINRQYSPTSYEVVIGINTDPTSHHCVTDKYETSYESEQFVDTVNSEEFAETQDDAANNCNESVAT